LLIENNSSGHTCQQQQQQQQQLATRKLTYSETPLLGLIQVVWDRVGIKNSQSCGVQRVLGNRNHDADLVVRNNHLEGELDTSRGSLGQKDLGRISWVSITLGNELGNALTDVRDSLGVRVGTDRANVLEQQLCAGNSIAGVEFGSSFGVLVLEKFGVFNKRSNLYKY
jgi:hypothetical protein